MFQTVCKLLCLVLCTALCLCIFVGCDKEEPPSQPSLPSLPSAEGDNSLFDLARANENSIRVMCYNVRTDTGALSGNDSWLKTRRDAQVAHMKHYSPDLIGMQEVKAHQLVFLAEQLGEEYDYVAVGREENDTGENNPIFYKKSRFELIDTATFWLSSTPETVSKYDGAACHRICTYVILKDKQTDREIIHYNTHLDHVSEEARRFGANVIMEQLDLDHSAYFLTGDFNTHKNSAAYNTITETMQDVQVIAQKTMDGPSYHGYKDTAKGTPIDFIFTSDAFTSAQFAILHEKWNGVYTSDHYAVIADLEYA